jgi:hypothetical protein
MAERLFKSSVPLEDGEIKKTPGYKPSSDAPPYAPPSNEVYVKHYAGTKVRYNIIYANNDFVFDKLPVTYSNKAMSVQEFVKSLNDSIKVFEGKNDDESKFAIRETKSIIDYLSGKENCVNVIANAISESDSVGPEATDHDIGHYILDERSHNKLSSYFSRSKLNEVFSEAFWKDYHVIVNYAEKDIKLEERYFRGESGFLANIIDGILAKSFNMKESISAQNILSGNMTDIQQDILAYFNKEGETLGNLTLVPITHKFMKYNFISEIEDLNLPRILLSKGLISDIKDFNLRKLASISIIPKEDSLPNMNAAAFEWLNSVEKEIKKEIQALVGKVLILW